LEEICASLKPDGRNESKLVALLLQIFLMPQQQQQQMRLRKVLLCTQSNRNKRLIHQRVVILSDNAREKQQSL
jgi:hypothetical protein